MAHELLFLQPVFVFVTIVGFKQAQKYKTTRLLRTEVIHWQTPAYLRYCLFAERHLASPASTTLCSMQGWFKDYIFMQDVLSPIRHSSFFLQEERAIFYH